MKTKWKLVRWEGDLIAYNKENWRESVKLISGVVHRFPVIHVPAKGFESGLSGREILAGYKSLLESAAKKCYNMTKYLLIPWLMEKSNRRKL